MEIFPSCVNWRDPETDLALHMPLHASSQVKMINARKTQFIDIHVMDKLCDENSTSVLTWVCSKRYQDQHMQQTSSRISIIAHRIFQTDGLKVQQNHLPHVSWTTNALTIHVSNLHFCFGQFQKILFNFTIQTVLPCIVCTLIFIGDEKPRTELNLSPC